MDAKPTLRPLTSLPHLGQRALQPRIHVPDTSCRVVRCGRKKVSVLGVDATLRFLRDHRSMDSALGHLHAGFVAMEYFALILNRSFLIFITDEGLRGWKFCGPVTTSSPQFYRPIEELLDDPEMECGSAAFTDLMHGPDTFLIPYKAIRSVDFTAKTKWGMGPILHAGILSLGLTAGRKREFILLGAAYGDGIRDAILAKTGCFSG